MGLTNRDKDASEQKDVYTWSFGRGQGTASGSSALATGATAWIGMVPYPGVIQSARSIAVGLSGAMQIKFQLLRFAGGGTTIQVGISNMVLNEVGTSGIIGYSGLAATGSTLLLVASGDVLQIETAVANTAAQSLVLEVVIKKTQDIVAYNGISS